MQDLTITHADFFFRAHWEPQDERWVCDCPLFELIIHIDEDSPSGIAYRLTRKDHDRVLTEWQVREIIQAIVQEAMQAVEEKPRRLTV